MRRNWTWVAVAITALVALSCGGAEDDEAAADSATATDPDVSVAGSELGDILVDADGMTLYLFTEDSDGRSECEGGCAEAWPPLLVGDEPVAGDGVDASLLSTTERDDGEVQLTYAGSPLYTWAQDEQPGDVTGQGVQDVWFVVSPEGEPVGDDDAAAATADETMNDPDRAGY